MIPPRSSSPTAPELRWLSASDDVTRIVAMRRAVYGGELGWLGEDSGASSEVAWDDYDRHSTTLAVHLDGALVASSRLTFDDEGPLEVSDLVDWKAEVPGAAGKLAAEWSRVMIADGHRRHGLFRLMYRAILEASTARGAALLCGASVAELRPHYAKLGFTYLDLPFRSHFFAASPVYFPAYRALETR